VLPRGRLAMCTLHDARHTPLRRTRLAHRKRAHRVADEGFDAAADVPDRPARQPGQVCAARRAVSVSTACVSTHQQCSCLCLPACSSRQLPQHHTNACTWVTHTLAHTCTAQVTLVAPGDVPKLGRGGTLASRQAIIHR
jgi:hypothetical protein